MCSTSSSNICEQPMKANLPSLFVSNKFFFDLILRPLSQIHYIFLRIKSLTLYMLQLVGVDER